jgi:hypothetical protein
MIDLYKYNRFNIVRYNGTNNVIIKNDIKIPSVINKILESVGLVKIDSEFTTDFDFFISVDNKLATKSKSKYYGKPIYSLSDTVKFFLSKRENLLQKEFMHSNILPMILSKDSESRVLGYSILVNELSYSDITTINMLIDRSVYPYTHKFSFNYYKKEFYLGCKDIWPLLHCVLKTYHYDEVGT